MQDPAQRHPKDDLLQWQVIHLALCILDESATPQLLVKGVQKPNLGISCNACWWVA